MYLKNLSSNKIKLYLYIKSFFDLKIHSVTKLIVKFEQIEFFFQINLVKSSPGLLSGYQN